MADRQIGSALAWALLTGLSVFALVATDSLAERGESNVGGAALLAVAMAVFVLLAHQHSRWLRRMLVEHPWPVATTFGACCAVLALAFDVLAVGGVPTSDLVGPAVFAGVAVLLVTRLLLVALRQHRHDQ